MAETPSVPSPDPEPSAPAGDPLAQRRHALDIAMQLRDAATDPAEQDGHNRLIELLELDIEEHTPLDVPGDQDTGS